MEWRNNKDRNIIIKEMLKSGESITHIAKILGISKSTVSYYKKSDYAHSLIVNSRIANAKIKSRKAGAIVRDKWHTKTESVRSEARNRWLEVKNNPQLMALLSFYWGEGDKRSKTNTGKFSISNSDPGFIAVCCNILRSLKAELSASISIYNGQDLESAKVEWTKILGFEPTVYVAKKMVDNKIFYSKYGTCHLRVVRSLILWHTIMTWIECWSAEFGITDNWQLTPRYQKNDCSPTT